MTQTNAISREPSRSSLEKTERTPASRQGRADLSAASASSASKTDAASLSGIASLLASGAVKGDDVRTARVAALQAAINDGSYNVPAADVADKLMRTMLE